MSPRRGSCSVADVESSIPTPVPVLPAEPPNDGIYKAVVEGSPQMTEIWGRVKMATLPETKGHFAPGNGYTWKT